MAKAPTPANSKTSVTAVVGYPVSGPPPLPLPTHHKPAYERATIEEDEFEEMFNIGDMEHCGQFYYEDVVIMGSGLWMKEEKEQDINDF